MERLIQWTEDGSPTVAVPALSATYHSRYGAVQESLHVFIANGFLPLLDKQKVIRILEVGFGTGLNALLTLREAISRDQPVYYETVEPYPLIPDEYRQLNYGDLLEGEELQDYFLRMHECVPSIPQPLHPLMKLVKKIEPLETASCATSFDLIYFDAFAPDVQPELWTQPVFEKMYQCLNNNGRLVTYCSKGTVRRAMQAAGFLVEKLPGPAHKREITRAIKRV